MGLIRMCKHNRDGAISTQKNRKAGLKAIAHELTTLGFDLPSASSLKPKHTLALTEHWKSNDLSKATIRNRLSWLRWWAQKINKAPAVERSNASYNAERSSIAQTDRAFTLDQRTLNRVPCKYIKASLMLQATFGLRREEALKFQPEIAIRKNHIVLASSWTKGGRARTIPITDPLQRKVLQAISKMVRKGSLIPPDKSYVQHLKSYEYQTARAGLRNTHGLRHAYAQKRYRELTNMVCPLAGGKNRRTMTKVEQVLDRQARLQISRELGHGRLAITDIYLGKGW